VFQCHVLPWTREPIASGFSRCPPALVSFAASSPRPPPPLDYFFFVFRSRPHWNARKQQEKPEEAKKYRSNRKNGVQAERPERTSGNRHRGATVFYLLSLPRLPLPVPRSSQLNIFSPSESPSVSRGTDPIGNAVRIHVDHSPARVRSARGTALPCPPATHARWRRAPFLLSPGRQLDGLLGLDDEHQRVAEVRGLDGGRISEPGLGPNGRVGLEGCAESGRVRRNEVAPSRSRARRRTGPEVPSEFCVAVRCVGALTHRKLELPGPHGPARLAAARGRGTRAIVGTCNRWEWTAPGTRAPIRTGPASSSQADPTIVSVPDDRGSEEVG
jgi:hypothetical protein